MTKVSALVSAYHAEKYIQQRLINLYGQKGVDVEVIVVCQNGSAEHHLIADYDLTLITTPDIPTIGKAWNMAIEASTGDYLTTANTDDRYKIGGLKRMVDTLDEHPEIGLVFAQVDIDDGERQYPWQRINNDTGEVENIRQVLESRCIVGPMPLWKKWTHDRVGMFNEFYTVACDYDLWRRMAEADVRFYYIAESMGVYLRRPDSLEHRNPIACRQETRMVQA
jgi:cellulose synthase/poly-beta-1,6-N-acetylglucosamine synthase-like glycosyltransferase